MPAYVACEKGFMGDEGLQADIEIAATAWLVPQKLASGNSLDDLRGRRPPSRPAHLAGPGSTPDPR